MKIKKESILKAFRMFSNMYQEFNKRLVNKEKMEEMIEDWVTTFEVMNFDYESANEDFLKAVKISITKCKYTPTIAEIIEEMRNVYIEKERKKEYKAIDTSKLTEEEYDMLMKKKITIEELIEKGRVNVE